MNEIDGESGQGKEPGMRQWMMNMFFVDLLEQKQRLEEITLKLAPSNVVNEKNIVKE